MFRQVRRHTMIFVGDANKVNDALFGQVVSLVQQQKTLDSDSVAESGSARPFTFGLQIKCQIHQVCLTRKTLALGLKGFWPTLVRLAHLYESHSFRQRIYLSIAQIVRENFDFFLVSELPPEATLWRETAIRRLKLFSDSCAGRESATSVSRRLKSLQQLLQKDNSDISNQRFVHFCVGEACCPGGAEEALSSMISSYVQVFAFIPVPLLYRWKHAPTACSFVRDGCCLHSVLPRALELMPRVKCGWDWDWGWGPEVCEFLLVSANW